MASRTAAPRLTSGQVCGRFRASPEAQAQLVPSLPPADFAGKLMEHGLYKDAMVFVACCLDRREAVWWGCLCCQHALGSVLDGKETAALGAAVRWVIDCKEEHRQAAAKAGEAAGGPANPAGALALAAGWSGGSMTPAGLPEVKPPEFLTQNVVGAALLALAARAQPADSAAACRNFLTLAWDVANGRNRWQPAT